MEEQAAPEFLFHYTSEQGLDGILSSDSIWGTHYRFLNDNMERMHGLELFKKALFQAAYDKFGVLNAPNTLVDYFVRTTTNVLDGYIVSFCADTDNCIDSGDRLSQWRGYSHGTQGYCLVFNSRLIHGFRSAGPQARYSHWCIYTEFEKDEICKELSNELLNGPFRSLTVNDLSTYDSLRKAITEDTSTLESWNEFVLNALLYGNLFKHEGFREENEYRFLCFFTLKSNISGIRFRPGKTNPIPYIAISLGLKKTDCPLKKIVVGPSLNKEQMASNLRIRLRMMGLSNIRVETSEIPYRG
jgi:Protein of unknown function (DUF2971).